MKPSVVLHLLSILLRLSQYGLTALIAASEEGHLNVVEKLLEANAKPDHQDNVRMLVSACSRYVHFNFCTINNRNS